MALSLEDLLADLYALKRHITTGSGLQLLQRVIDQVEAEVKKTPLPEEPVDEGKTEPEPLPEEKA